MAHQVYENKILSTKINEMLTTKVNLNQYMTIDTSMTEGAGMTKQVRTYSATGAVEELGMGEGNTSGIEIHFDPVEYTVKTYQGKFAFHDEEEMKDPMIVDAGLEKAAKEMVNTFNALAIAEYDKATLTHSASAWGFEAVVDAIAKMNLEAEDGLFLLISPADQAKFRKSLKDDLKYSEGFARTGYIGSVAGVPVIISKAIEAGNGYLATKDAVTVFIKKDTETETARNADLRHNTYWVRKFGVVALTNADKVVKITVAA